MIALASAPSEVTTPTPAEPWLAALAPVSLEALQGAALLDRLDTKFVLTPAQLDQVMARAAASYDILCIDGARAFAYTTTYYDSPERTCFRDHLRGRPVRVKVRVRRYPGRATAWLEVKRRQADGRTRKIRRPVPGGEADVPAVGSWPPELTEALPTHLEAATMQPLLDVRYQRSTLLGRGSLSERVTIDRRLLWTAPGARPVSGADGLSVLAAAHVVIVELKQGARIESPMRHALRDLGIRPMAVSKYCLGVTALDPSAAPTTLRTQLQALCRAP